ncbi:MAG: site-specific integrase [Spirochaetaceae bacterium]|nr:site-specific integrase [Spirochaetaceae bacterium]
MEKTQLIDEVLFKLFISDIGEKEAQQIIEILKYKNLFPLRDSTFPATRLIGFLTDFWNWEHSPYIKNKVQQRHGIHKQYVARCAAAIRNYWLPWFGSTYLLQDLSRQALQTFVYSFSTTGIPVSAQARNDIIRSGTVALKWAFRNGLLATDITTGIIYYSVNSPEILILSEQMVQQLFKQSWKHEKAMLANKLAMITGMRAGEIQALRGCDICSDCIHVRHSWNRLDGLKPPKNGHRRIVYIPFPEIITKLKELSCGEEDFIFRSGKHNKPMDAKCWLRNLRLELSKIGVENKVIEQIHFHSWRHFFTVHMKNTGRLETRLLQRMTGHKSASMMEYYADHPLQDDAKKVKSASEKVFASLLN